MQSKPHRRKDARNDQRDHRVDGSFESERARRLELIREKLNLAKTG